jgi:voltage-gated potassium channel Kch
MKFTASSLGYYRARLRDPSLTALLAVQLLIIFVLVPVSASSTGLPASVPAALLLTFMSIAVFLAEGRWTVFAGLALLAASGGVVYMERGVPGMSSRIAVAGMSLLIYATLSTLVLSAVFGPGAINAHRIRGAIVLYLNIGLMFASVDRIIAETIPGAYHGLPPSENLRGLNAAMTYFSFTTLTTVGYGDITPIHPIARSFAMLESIIGPLFPATLLARIVTLEIEARRSAPKGRRPAKPSADDEEQGGDL